MGAASAMHERLMVKMVVVLRSGDRIVQGRFTTGSNRTAMMKAVEASMTLVMEATHKGEGFS